MQMKPNGPNGEWLLAQVSYRGDGCLLWPFGRDTSGYGQVSFDGKIRRAHRVMCQLVKGDPPTPEHQAAHSCGRGHEGCIHPEHLDWKTNAQNQLDRRKHGTERKKGVPRFKLTEEQVASIRSMKGQQTHAALGAMFGVSRDTIGKVLAGRTWKTGKRITNGFDKTPWTHERREAYRSNQ